MMLMEPAPVDADLNAAGQAAFMDHNSVCPGCKRSVVDENGGVVVAFGQSFFHVDCFRCAKCHQQVTADTNLLLLSDGSPICSNCSYSCNVCHLPILDEAIMTGDDSYHAHCFKCKVCKNRIDELVFAKTSQGIYCMDCHNARVARSRRHAQKQKERQEAAAKAALGALPKPPEAVPPEMPKQNGSAPAYNSDSLRSNRSRNGTSPSRPGTQDTVSSEPAPPAQSLSTSTSTANKRRSVLPTADMLRIKEQLPTPSRSQTDPSLGTSAPAPAYSRQNSLQSTSSVTSQETSSMGSAPTTPYGSSRASPKMTATSLGVPDAPRSSLDKRKSFDDGVRPLNVLLSRERSGSNSSIHGNGTNGLQVPDQPTPRNRKRQSINPGLTLSDFSLPETNTSSSRSSPTLTSNLGGYSGGRSQTPPVTYGRDSPRLRSPLRDYFPGLEPHSRPVSHASSNQDEASVYHSPPSTPGLPDRERDRRPDPLPTRTRAPSISRNSLEGPRPPPRSNASLDRAPPRNASLGSSGLHASLERTGGRLSPAGARPPSLTLPPRASSRGSNGKLSPTPSGEPERSRSPRSLSRSRPPSPYRADVPHGIESGTDTENENENENEQEVEEEQSPERGREGPESGRSSRADEESEPPSPPSKDLILPSELPDDDVSGDLSETGNDSSTSLSQADGGEGTSSPVEEGYPVEHRMSHSTFIAPALPPIRFSMSGPDLSDLLKFGGSQSRQSLDQLTQLREEEPPASPEGGQIHVEPPTSATPTNHTTFDDAASAHSATPSAGDEDHTMRLAELNGAHKDTSRGPGRPRAASVSSQSSTHSFVDVHPGGNRSINTPSPDTDALLSSVDSADSHSSHSQSPAHAHGSQSQSPPGLGAHITVTAPDSQVARPLKSDKVDLVVRRLQEVLTDANARGASHVKLDRQFVEAIVTVMDHRQQQFAQMRTKFDGAKRTSQQYIEGMTVAQTEYDRELKARRDAEAEVTRLRILLSGQAARLTALSGATRKHEVQQQLSQELSENLTGLERKLSKLKVERDMTLAEVEELSEAKSAPSPVKEEGVGRSLSVRYDKLKNQYKGDLVSLMQNRETLVREIAELKANRDIYLEETTALNARNEELAKLSSQYARRAENAAPERSSPGQDSSKGSIDRQRHPLVSASTSSLTASTTGLSDESNGTPFVKISRPDIDATPVSKPKVFKWPGSKMMKEPAASPATSGESVKSKGFEHTFQQLNILRFARCDHCGDKMWGSQYRCSSCHVSVHPRCLHNVLTSCAQQSPGDESSLNLDPLPQSMFGRDLIEQVRADARGGERYVPVIVEKCIDAVEALALDYEGIYRKTGGSGQSKIITQLFERGAYNSFDLRDTDRFNDICSVTSVLKNYFRGLPDPLLTYALHERFMLAAVIRDEPAKTEALTELVNELPLEHFQTLRMLMLHLNRVCEHRERNLMSARNLGVVFGPTLMRSRDPTKEFSDMAGKALSVEWLVEQAPSLFT